ncbi:hypothetical protein ACFWN5_25360 [Streptomyces sp. NPDC058430]|uniref:hypothetical protein n=1 Tax=Streptomyces sp. NPDC058430 TaxID=3346495 RepID=UPI0036515FAE
MSQQLLARLALLPAVMLPLVVACSPDHPDSGKASKPAAPNKSEPATPTRESVKIPPELDGTETVAGRQSGTRGGRTLEYRRGQKGKDLIVAVRCQGKGEIKVSLNPVKVGFPLKCVDGEVTTTYNQVGVTGVEKKGTVSVQAPSTVRWSLTIGRGEAPEGAR